jgi:branched-chain amino acid transport system substrate-binding protein
MKIKIVPNEMRRISMPRKRHGRSFVSASAILSLGITLAACGSSAGTDATTSASGSTGVTTASKCMTDIFGPGGKAAGQGVTIKAGMLLAMTGAGAFFGDVMSKGAQLAADQIKAAGGIDYQIEIADHKNGDVPTALTETKRMISDGIEVLQTSYGAPSEAIAPLIAAAPVLTINGGGSSPGQLSKDFLWQNRMVFADDPNAGSLAWIHKTYPNATRLALVGTQENGVQTFNTTAPANWKALGGTIVASEQHAVGTTDFKALAAKIKAANPDVIQTFSFGDDLGYQVKDFRAAGITVPIIGIEFTSNAAKIAGSAYDTFTFGTDFYNAENLNPWNKCFVDAYRAKYNKDPEYYGANYYEQVFIFWELVKRVIASGGNPNDPAALQAALKSDPMFKSVYGGDAATVGQVTFDTTDHSISKPMGVFLVKNGKPVLVQPIVKIKAGADPMTALSAK